MDRFPKNKHRARRCSQAGADSLSPQSSSSSESGDPESQEKISLYSPIYGSSASSFNTVRFDATRSVSPVRLVGTAGVIQDPDDALPGTAAFIGGFVLGVAYWWAQHTQFTDTVEFLAGCRYQPFHSKAAMVAIDLAVLYFGVLQVNILWLRQGFQFLFDFFKDLRSHHFYCGRRWWSESEEAESLILHSASRLRRTTRGAILVLALLTVVSGIGVGLRAVPASDLQCPNSVLPFEESEAYKYIFKVLIDGCAGGLMNLASLAKNYKQWQNGELSLAAFRAFSRAQQISIIVSTTVAALAYFLMNWGTCKQLEKTWQLGSAGWILYGLFIAAGTIVNAGLYYFNAYKTISAFNLKLERFGEARENHAPSFANKISIFLKNESADDTVLSCCQSVWLCLKDWAIWIISLVNAAPLFMATLQHGAQAVGVDYLKFYRSVPGCFLMVIAGGMWMNRTILTRNSRKQPNYNVPVCVQSFLAPGILQLPELPKQNGYRRFRRVTNVEHFSRAATPRDLRY